MLSTFVNFAIIWMLISASTNMSPWDRLKPPEISTTYLEDDGIPKSHHCDLQNFEMNLSPWIPGRHIKNHKGTRTHSSCTQKQDAYDLSKNRKSLSPAPQESAARVHPQLCFYDGPRCTGTISHWEAKNIHSILAMIYSSGQDLS